MKLVTAAIFYLLLVTLILFTYAGYLIGSQTPPLPQRSSCDDIRDTPVDKDDEVLKQYVLERNGCVIEQEEYQEPTFKNQMGGTGL